MSFRQIMRVFQRPFSPLAASSSSPNVKGGNVGVSLPGTNIARRNSQRTNQQDTRGEGHIAVDRVSKSVMGLYPLEAEGVTRQSRATHQGPFVGFQDEWRRRRG